MPKSEPEEASGWSDLLKASSLAPLAAVCLGVWLHAADGLMVATLIPDIIADIGGAHVMAWSLALYEIGSIVAGAVSAVLALRYGLRWAMSGSALLYMAGCVLSALAPDIGVMLVGRLAQGLGGGGLVALSFVAIPMLFSRALMPRVIASVSALWGVSSFVGPLIGGLFAEWDLWRGGFWFFAGQAALLAAWIAFGGALAGAKQGESAAGHIPAVRLSMLGFGVVLIATGGIAVSVLWTPLCLVAGFGLLALFFVLDGRAGDSRLMPHGAVDPRRPLGAALIMVFAFCVSTVAASIYGPLMMIALHGISALEAGYLLAISSIGWSAAAISASGSPERRDPLLIFIGMVIVALGVAGYVIAIPEGPIWLIALSAALEGGGFGLAWTFVLRRLTALTSAEDSERVSSALPTIQRLGYAVGAALIGLVANAAGVAEHMDWATAHHAAVWIFAAAAVPALLGLIPAIAFIRSGDPPLSRLAPQA